MAYLVYKNRGRFYDPGQAASLRFSLHAAADRTIPVIATPEKVIADATSATYVGAGSICRIFGAGTEFVVFGDSTVGVPSVSTQTAALLANGVNYIVASDEFIRTSAAVRVEVVPITPGSIG